MTRLEKSGINFINFWIIISLLLVVSCTPKDSTTGEDDNNDSNNHDSGLEHKPRKPRSKDKKKKKKEPDKIPFSITVTVDKEIYKPEEDIVISVEIKNNATEEKDKAKRKLNFECKIKFNDQDPQSTLKEKDKVVEVDKNGKKFTLTIPSSKTNIGKYVITAKLTEKGVKVEKQPAPIEIEVKKDEPAQLEIGDFEDPETKQQVMDQIKKTADTISQEKDFNQIIGLLKQDKSIRLHTVLKSSFTPGMDPDMSEKLLAMPKAVINHPSFSYKGVADIAKGDGPLNNLLTMMLDPQNLSNIEKIEEFVFLLIEKSSFDDLNDIKIDTGVPNQASVGIYKLIENVSNSTGQVDDKVIQSFKSIQKKLDKKASDAKQTWTDKN